jgi:nucleotide-binding universal stress UspA family protein
MALRSLLVHVDDSDRCAHRLAFASRLAHEFAAQLVGVYLVPTPELTPSIAALLPDDIVERQLRATGQAQNLAEARFSEMTQRANLVTIQWRAPAGDAAKAIAAHARGVDLAVIGQTAPEDSAAAFADELASASILTTGRPVLIVPHRGGASSVGRAVLVAWNDSKEAARAVTDALPILVKARRVVVVTVNTADEQDDVDGQAFLHIEAYLRRHGVIAAFRQPRVVAGNVAEVLLAQARETAADLIVMGAYGHARLRERLLGGVTHAVLTTTTIPVLMSH